MGLLSKTGCASSALNTRTTSFITLLIDAFYRSHKLYNFFWIVQFSILTDKFLTLWTAVRTLVCTYLVDTVWWSSAMGLCSPHKRTPPLMQVQSLPHTLLWSLKQASLNGIYLRWPSVNWVPSNLLEWWGKWMVKATKPELDILQSCRAMLPIGLRMSILKVWLLSGYQSSHLKSPTPIL